MFVSSRIASRRWLHGLSVAIFFAASSCAQAPVGEFTADACTDNQDNDGDLLRDCDDPDCWVFCPYRGNFEIGDASSSMSSDASFDAAMTPAADSGKTHPTLDDDAGTGTVDPSSDDAGSLPSTCQCASDETCVDGQCQPVPSPNITGTYTLSVKSAYVPLGPSNDRCFDYSAVGCVQRVPVICECSRPDPYVVVLLEDKVLMKATTAPVQNTASPVWSAAPVVTIDLNPMSKLKFIAFDSDAIMDQQIFSCMPVLSTLESGTDVLSCNPAPGTTVTPPAGNNYYITAEVRKIVPDAAMP
jgi:hypothetical protein